MCGVVVVFSEPPFARLHCKYIEAMKFILSSSSSRSDSQALDGMGCLLAAVQFGSTHPSHHLHSMFRSFAFEPKSHPLCLVCCRRHVLLSLSPEHYSGQKSVTPPHLTLFALSLLPVRSNERQGMIFFLLFVLLSSLLQFFFPKNKRKKKKYSPKCSFPSRG